MLVIRYDQISEVKVDGHPIWAYHFRLLDKAGIAYRVSLGSSLSGSIQKVKSYTHNAVSVEARKGDNDICVRANSLWPESLLPILQREDAFRISCEGRVLVERGGKEVAVDYDKTGDEVLRLDPSKPIQCDLLEALIHKGHLDLHPIRLIPGFEIIRGEQKGRPKALFSAPHSFFPDDIRSEFESLFDITYAFNADRDTTMSLLQEVKLWITGTCPPYFIDRELVDAGSQLRMIATPSTGTTHMDRDYIESKNLTLCSIKSSDFIKNIKASSEHTLALLMAMVRKLPFTNSRARLGEWRERETEFRSIELAGKTMGILGYGRIGSNLARYCHALEMNVVTFDPNVEVKENFVQQLMRKEDILEKSDIVAVCYHLDAQTAGSFTKEDFVRMKEGSYFLNTARGELVNEEAMLDALRSGKLKAAAVDVITHEAEVYKWDHPVIKYARENENLILTPHIAGLTVDSETKAAMEILSEIKKNWNGE